MQNAEFADLTQTTIFYIQDLFQSIFKLLYSLILHKDALKHNKEWIT